MSRTSADLAVVGATVHTLDPARPAATAIAVRGGTVLAVGDDAEIGSLCDARTEIVDGTGVTVTPGLTDGHLHPVHGSLMTAGLDLSQCRDVDELRGTLAESRRDLAAGDWIRGFGLDPNILGGQRPHRRLVDDVLGEVPALLVLADAHAALASGAALRLAGVTGPVELPGNSEVVCDADGNPTGEILEDAAKRIIERAAPETDPADTADLLADLFQRMHATGLTGGHVMDLDDGSLAALRLLDERGLATPRLRLAPWCQPGIDGSGLRELIDLQGTSGRLWTVAGVKLFMDGTIDNGTAWLEHPDCHGESTKPYWLPPSEYAEAVGTLARAGVATATHAIGDAAVTFALDCLARYERPCVGGARHRIEHLETLPDELVQRMSASGVAASMQPSHLQYTKADHTDNWSTRLGGERANRAWRCADLVRAGATLVLGSDWPIAHFDPREVLGAARLRRLPGRPDSDPVQSSQALTAREALEAMTVAPAEVAGEQHVAGRISPGFRADLTGFGVDLLTAGPDELAEAPVRLTVVDGAVVHRA
ncbi:amidohydrolase [Saccharopolyspora mangrovi]|uniref:Amidohydrolase n=1 Tax=Saccharopolyspora mangrovi TaxID=3082379 RepID=A0ABU6ALD8_9PSEU|nr:amidohydrolase [Saccharopolyspora sp. S2-29]MEB3372135.1 amidohydrolase [Saccharopolyspora sp. S2-29]